MGGASAQAITEKASVLFSGGQDSTTCLAWALDRFDEVETVAFDYGQRHKVGLACRDPIAAALRRLSPQWAKRLGEDHLVDLGVLGRISDTALTREAEITFGEYGLPTTFVPGRNLLFLTFAAAIAYRRGARHLVCRLLLAKKTKQFSTSSTLSIRSPSHPLLTRR